MDRVWARIERWLAVNAPESAAGLNPPASNEELDQAEALLGVRLPQDVRASFRRHDGQAPNSPWLMDGWEWLSLARVQDEWKVWKDLLAAGTFDGSPAGGDDITVRSDWWNAAWIPLTYSGSGDHHCLDLAPGPKGATGQIIEMWHDASERPVVASGIREWLMRFADELEAGCFAPSEEYGGLCRREDAEPAPTPKPLPAAPGGRPLPTAFDASDEPVKLLAKAKSKVAKNFKWTRYQCLADAVRLAHLLHLFARDDEALEICRAVGEYRFSGGYELWSAVERALALQSRLTRARGGGAEAEECVRRIHEAGFVDERLEGLLFDPNDAIPEAMKDGDRRWEQAARLSLAGELAFVIELGGSAKLPVPELERRWEENRARLRELTGAPG